MVMYFVLYSCYLKYKRIRDNNVMGFGCGLGVLAYLKHLRPLAERSVDQNQPLASRLFL